MKMSITTTQFIDEFKNYNRGNQFSYGALCAIFDYYEEIDENYELDVIDICCQWTEYKSLEDVYEAYGFDSKNEYDEMIGELENMVSYILISENNHYLIMD